MCEAKKVIILWTGGWDSTFRLLQLAENEIIIQPIYVIDSGRRSKEFEQKAMTKILDKMKGDLRFKAKIEDIKRYEIDWIMENCKDDQISEDYRYLHEKYRVGSQYEWLALLCKHEGIQVESGVESTLCPIHGRVSDAIIAEGELEPIKDDFLKGRMHVVPKDGMTAVSNVLENMIFTLADITKKDMEHIAREKGWIDIMELTWFCHMPINGKPCGICNPCDDAMHEGMEWRIPVEAQRRHRHRRLSLFLYRIDMCLKRIYREME